MVRDTHNLRGEDSTSPRLRGTSDRVSDCGVDCVSGKARRFQNSHANPQFCIFLRFLSEIRILFLTFLFCFVCWCLVSGVVDRWPAEQGRRSTVLLRSVSQPNRRLLLLLTLSRHHSGPEFQVIKKLNALSLELEVVLSKIG